MLKNLLMLSIAIFTLSSCSTSLQSRPGVPEISNSEYESQLSSKTEKIEVYSGLTNTLTVKATLLDSKVSEASLAQTAKLQQWDEAKYKEEKEKKISLNTQNTEFFVSFYTPERKHSDLSTNRNIWNIFLDINGQRYIGKATKIKLLLSEVQALYDYHNRWSVPYIVTFPVPTSVSETNASVLTFTGAAGSAQLNFNKK